MKTNRIWAVIGLSLLVAAFALFVPEFAHASTVAHPILPDFGNFAIATAAVGAVPEEVKRAMEPVMTAFDTFKKSIDEQIAEVKKGISDPLLSDRIGKIEKSMDAGIEARNAIDAAIKAEKKEREELELKIGRMNLSGHSKESAKREVEIKSFNDMLTVHNSARNRTFAALDSKGYDDYKSALDRYNRVGKDNLTPEEAKTLSVGSDPDGGYFVTPDTGGQIVKKVFETSPVRQNASVMTISTDALEGIEDINEAGAGYAGETAQGGDTTTPQIGKWRIQPYWIDTEPKTTQQLLDDSSVNIEEWLGGKVSDKFSRFENSEFINGAANKIRGFMLGYVSAADSGSGVTWGQLGYKGTGVNGDFAATTAAVDNLIDLMGLLKNAYLTNAKWYTRRSVITKMRKFKDTTGQPIWAPNFGGGFSESIFNYPIVRMEDMPALATGSLSLAFGDLAQAYQIVDRSGIRVLRDNLTSKPYVKFYTTKRTGGGVVNFEALKLLKFS